MFRKWDGSGEAMKAPTRCRQDNTKTGGVP
jgi:hypothetical protein